MSRATNARVVAATKAIRSANIPGISDVVPAFAALTVHFDPLVVEHSKIFEAIAEIEISDDARSSAGRLVDIPVLYGGEAGPDLDKVTRDTGLTTTAVVDLHSSAEYHVYMLGFLPGFAYLGDLDEKLRLPRLKTPRTHVPAGSVAIADQTTAIYPLEISRRLAADRTHAAPSFRSQGRPTRCVGGRRQGPLSSRDGHGVRTHRGRRLTFEILDPGLQTTVQDLGRRGHLALGVPLSGALDVPTLRLANLLVDNGEAAAALECRSPGPVLRVSVPSARIALVGTQASLIVERGGDTEEWSSWRSVDLVEGDIVRVAPFADTAVAYLAIAGGVAVPEVLGSCSTFLRGGFGGLRGRALKVGDALSARDRERAGPCLTLIQPPLIDDFPTLRVIRGPQAAMFGESTLSELVRESYTVTRDLDRMGARLNGPELVRRDSSEMLSDGTVPGALQVPPSGQPILLLADCQTTGGYPKIATVISADIPAAGRLMAGSRVRFAWVDVEEAVDALGEAERLFHRRVGMIATVREGTRFSC